MITRKEIGLWLINPADSQPVQKTLVSIDLTKKRKHEIDPQLLYWFWHSQKLDYTFRDFNNIFLKTLSGFNKLLSNIIRQNNIYNPYCRYKTADLYDELLNTELSFADPEAFKFKTAAGFRRDEEDEIEEEEIGRENDNNSAAAYYSTLEGIVLSSQYAASFTAIKYLFAHEYGHCLDYLLNPTEYAHRSATMTEVMALLAQCQRGINAYYRRGPHKRAQEILRALNKTKFSKLTFAEKWLFLKPVIDHKQIYKRIFIHFLG